ncbi:uncharacterized protein EV422DRAFT_524360 [Fimicolochytrium jonesii]|uniref:uncharacterized protein n=1 Tax=Fimicolochytrium jonesii TaxID=1396493 RepID=UPI0022FF33E4|nr:uncharacterized protein EV422DRAFT_524360 [Fimicolochytrium jonesii]KAI8822537.1 hypothetical protein EV422DRAFT_524360 [Fimicolochytrium jonesii]
MDVQMPVMNGIDAVAIIRRREREFAAEAERTNVKNSANTTEAALNGKQGAPSRTNIVVLTGLDSPEDQKAAMTAGADLFLTKPVSMKRLHAYISQLIDVPTSHIENIATAPRRNLTRKESRTKKPKDATPTKSEADKPLPRLTRRQQEQLNHTIVTSTDLEDNVSKETEPSLTVGMPPHVDRKFGHTARSPSSSSDTISEMSSNNSSIALLGD